MEAQYGVTKSTYDLLNASITSFSIVRNGETVSDRYTISGNQIVSEVKDENNEHEVIAELSKEGSQWKLKRNNFDNITITVEFESVKQTISATFEFTSPYEIIKSTTNLTNVIYSGTKFVLAQNKIESGAQAQDGGAAVPIDTLFTFVKKQQNGTITIEYKALKDSVTTYTPIGSDYVMNVPDETEPTNYEFVIKFDGIEIGSFGLTVKPNMIITADIDDLIRLDDLNNNTYKFEKLKISSYDTKDGEDNDIQYYSYTLDEDNDGKYDGLNPLKTLNLSYTYTTFTDNKFENTHTVNIANVADNTLTINPISNLGTYYINVTVNSGNINVGEVKFVVESASQVTNRNNGDVDSVYIDAKTTTEWDLDDLKFQFNLSQNGDKAHYFVDNWVETTEFKEGETYTYNDETKEYTLLAQAPAEDANIKMYRNEPVRVNAELSDILWMSHSNEHLTITYKYASATLTQNINTLTYNGNDYTLLGTSFNMVSDNGTVNFTFDITNDCFRDSDGNALPTQMFGENIAYYMKNGASVIYCKENAYLFENENEILAMSIDGNGKTLYSFVKNATNGIFEEIADPAGHDDLYYKKISENEYTMVYAGEQSSTKYKLSDRKLASLGNLQSLELLYDSFGSNLAIDASIIDSIDYKADLVFDYGSSKYTVASDEVYEIGVYSKRLTRTSYTVLSGEEYTLYAEYTIDNPPLFLTSENVEKVEFGAGSYTIVDETSIIFNASGNNHVVSLPVTLTYNDEDKTTFTYHVDITVVNGTVVDIKYPYNVDNSNQNEYDIFNASISELSNSVDGLYNINDFADWLGVDKTDTDWTSSTRFAYDLALRSDIINLTNVDDLHNTKRYNVYKYNRVVTTNEADNGFSAGDYYTYNLNTSKFELVQLTEKPNDWSSLKYFTRIEDTTTPISKIEVVATSSTYAIDDEIVKSWFALNDETIIVKSPADKAQDETLNLTGYVAFKVYAKDTGASNTGEENTGAYGYYVLKIVADDEFDKVVSFGEPRNTAVVPYKVSGGETFETIFKDSSTRKINTVANNISSDLILEDYSNVYLFKVDSENAQGEISDDNIKNGQYVPFGTKLTSHNQIQTITLAVVVRNGTSLVHVCNYHIVLQPNVEVTVNDSGIETTDAAHYEYSLKDGNEFKYSYTGTDSNSKNLSSYFNVTKDNSSISLTDVQLVTDGDKNSADVSVDGSTIKYKGNGIAEIEVGVEICKLKLLASVSERVEFWLKLIYGTDENAFNIYLRIILAPFEFNDTNQFTISNGVYSNTLDLTQVFGDYRGDYTYTITDLFGNVIETDTKTADADIATKTLTFPDTYEKTTYHITITLNNVYPNPTAEITVDVYPNINAEYNASHDGEKPTNKRVTADKVEHGDTLTAIGSTLNVNISETGGITTIIIDPNTIDETSQDYALTINAKGTCSVNFTLTGDNGEELKLGGNSYKYFVNGNELASDITLSSTGVLNFVHSAKDINARLNITIKNGENAYATTYVLYITIPKTYELSPVYRVDGTTFETVVAGTDLTLKKAEDGASHSIGDHFFGDEVEDRPVFIKSTEFENNKTYYTFDSDTKEYTKVIAPQAEDIATYYEKVVNESRVAIIVDDKYYYGYDNIVGLGLFMADNPNKLGFDIELTGDANTSSIDFGKLTFRGVDNVETTTLLLTNPTMETPVEYEFRIFTEENDYSNIEFNNNLLQIDGTPNNASVDLNYISIPYSQFNDGKNKLSVDLAYLQYYPESENQVARVVMINKSTNREIDELSYEFIRDISASDYISKLVLEDKGLDPSEVYEIDLVIITMNGVAGRVTLIIADFEAEYGYNKVNQSYEYVYGGTQIGTLSDKDRDGNTRLNYQYVLIRNEEEFSKLSQVYTYNGSTYTELKTKPEFAENTYYKYIEGYTLSYINTINGHVTQWRLGENLPYSKLVNYANNGMISLLTVAGDTQVTLVFNVMYQNRLVVGRIFYQLMIQNNLRIGVNPAVKDNVIDLYLGSEVYTRAKFDENSTEDDATVINLLESESGTNYNNLFVTLEQYSTGNTIENGNALYNGNTNSDLNTNSILSSNVVSKYLRFEIAEDDEVKGKVRVDESGKLYIKGNPSGSFVLKISAANETGYGIFRTININKYDYTQAQYSEAVNLYNGGGRASGESVQLFKDIGAQEDAEDKGKGDFAFASYRLGYALDATYHTPTTSDLRILDSGATITYKVLTFDYGTAVNDIKSSKNWDSATNITIKAQKKNGDDENTTKYADGGLCSITLPSVKSTSTTEKQYQIVSIRLTITYNDDSENHYYAHYLVYNAEQINVNEFYKDTNRGKVITYAETISDTDTTLVGAWQTDAKLTIMDTQNQGLYSATTLLRSKPDNWETEYGDYYKLDTTTAGKYVKVTLDKNGNIPTYSPDTYYKLNSMLETYVYEKANGFETVGKTYYIKNSDGTYSSVTGTTESPLNVDKTYYNRTNKSTGDKLDGYEAYIVKPDGTTVGPDDLTYVYNNDSEFESITMELPKNLFTNMADITIIVRATNGGANVIEDKWTIKAGITIEASDSKPLRDFFLLSEIGQNLYRDCNIIGLTDESITTTTAITNTTDSLFTAATGFLKEASKSSITKVMWTNIKSISTGDSGYYLYKVYYEAGNEASEHSVFSVTAEYDVLVGHSHAMSFTFNAGSDYFINLTIDENNIDNNTATINIADFVTIWTYNNDNGKFESSKPTALSVEEYDDLVATNGGEITLSDVNTILDNKFVSATITETNNRISREIDLYFNIVINALEYDSDNRLPYSENLDNAMIAEEALNGSPVVLTDDKMSTTLKKELLNLITYNDEPLSNNGNIDNLTLSRYSIEVTEGTEDYYLIKYTYTGVYAIYTRTLQMTKSAISAIKLNENKRLDYVDGVAELFSEPAVASEDDNTTETEDDWKTVDGETNKELKKALVELINFKGQTANVEEFTVKVANNGAKYYTIMYSATGSPKYIEMDKWTIKALEGKLDKNGYFVKDRNVTKEVLGKTDYYSISNSDNKNTMLGLITINPGSIESDKFVITATDKDEYLEIIYTYYPYGYSQDEGTLTISKTFRMVKAMITKNAEGNLPNMPLITTEMDKVDNGGTLTITDDNIINELLGLILLDGKEIESADKQDFTIKVTKTSSGYEVRYIYSNAYGTEDEETFIMEPSPIRLTDGVTLTNGMLSNISLLTKEMDDVNNVNITLGTEDSSDLKKGFLSLIKINNNDISINSPHIESFSIIISIAEDYSCYMIRYIYDGSSQLYEMETERTFKMALSPITAKELEATQNSMLSNNLLLTEAMDNGNNDEIVLNTEDNGDLKTELLGLINANSLGEPKITVNLVKDGNKPSHYSIKYEYPNDYRTFKMALSLIKLAEDITLTDGKLINNNEVTALMDNVEADADRNKVSEVSDTDLKPKLLSYIVLVDGNAVESKYFTIRITEYATHYAIRYNYENTETGASSVSVFKMALSPITAKGLEATENGMFANNSLLTKEMDDNGNDKLTPSADLKKELLKLIKFNNEELVSEELTEKGKQFTISIELGDECYLITYTYGLAPNPYYRRFKMDLSPIQPKDKDSYSNKGMFDNYEPVDTFMDNVTTDENGNKASEVNNETLNAYLLDLIDDLTEVGPVTITKTSDYYLIKYTYGEYYRTLKMALHSIQLSSTVELDENGYLTNNSHVTKLADNHAGSDDLYANGQAEDDLIALLLYNGQPLDQQEANATITITETAECYEIIYNVHEVIRAFKMALSPLTANGLAATENGMLANESWLTKEMDDRNNSKLELGLEDSSDLKKSLLSLIMLNEITVYDIYVPYFIVEVTSDESCYLISYTYEHEYTKHERTFKMDLSPITAKELKPYQNATLANVSSVTKAIDELETGDTIYATQMDEELKNVLVGLVHFDGGALIVTIYKRSDHYELTYCKSGDYSITRTFKMALSPIQLDTDVELDDNGMLKNNPEVTFEMDYNSINGELTPSQSLVYVLWDFIKLNNGIPSAKVTSGDDCYLITYTLGESYRTFKMALPLLSINETKAGENFNNGVFKYNSLIEGATNSGNIVELTDGALSLYRTYLCYDGHAITTPLDEQIKITAQHLDGEDFIRITYTYSGCSRIFKMALA